MSENKGRDPENHYLVTTSAGGVWVVAAETPSEAEDELMKLVGGIDRFERDPVPEKIYAEGSLDKLMDDCGADGVHLVNR